METREEWNKQANHPLQAWEWGEFRKLTGVKVVREGGLQVTIHPLPYTKWAVGYCPKAGMPGEEQVEVLTKIAKDNNCIMIKVEPKVEKESSSSLKPCLPAGRSIKFKALKRLGFVQGRSLFTKYNFVLDVRRSEEELLALMKQKTRYNIKIAGKNGVRVGIENSSEAFEKYLELTEETTKRQGFYAHGRDYHKKMWETLSELKVLPAGRQVYQVESSSSNILSAMLLVARYEGEIISTWVLFKFKDTLYYPYGASTRKHQKVMANNLMMWEAIKLAKKMGCSYLDMWGALGSEPDPKDPWYGFHNFKAGYGARHVEYVGSYDFVAKPILYAIFRVLDEIRWLVLRTLK